MAKKISKFTYPSAGTQADNIVEALQRFGLDTMAASVSFIVQKMQESHGTYQEFLEQLLRLEFDAKEQARIALRINQAKLGPIKTFREFDFKFQPSINPMMIRELASCRFLDEGKNIVLLGPPGVGKTHIATALAYEAILKGHEVRFVRANEFLDAIDRSSSNSLRKLHSDLQKPILLILDDIDYYTHDEESCRFYSQLIMDRYKHSRAFIITSNRDPSQWDNIFGKKGIKAINDRIHDVNRTVAIIINGGRSYRVPKPLAELYATKSSAASDEGLLKKITSVFSQNNG